MLRVIAYTGGTSVPSARFRVRQYIPDLARFDVRMTEMPARFGAYPPASRVLRPAWAVLSLSERVRAAFRSQQADVTLFQREMISTLATAERLTRSPRVLDVDDAIWLLRGRKSAASIARLCDAAICGNSFLADYFGNFVRRVFLLPTPVDTERYRPVPAAERSAGVICWSGCSSGLPYLYSMERALAVVLRRGERRLRVISDAPPRFESLQPEAIEFVPWSEQVEVRAIQTAAVGIMPLPDTAWARGKCSYKLLTYMACGLPVVATPVGMNGEILERGDLGFAPRTTAEWVDALETLLQSPERAAAMGEAGRERVLREYSLLELVPRLAAILQLARAGRN